MKILITNNSLEHRGGSELYTSEIAEKLLERGHKVAAYSNCVGELSEKMNRMGVETVDDLNKLSFKPDIIHGHHHLETMTAISHFPNTPAIYVCHGWRPWQELPPLHPRILQYFAIDSMTLDFAVKNGVPKSKIKLIYNFVDLERFKQRKPLPKKPEKALIFNNAATKTNYVTNVEEACRKAGIKKVDIVGRLSGNVVDEPEKMLKNYDIVFARGRCSLESLVTGTALVICAETGVGPMVTTKNMMEMRDKNFGVAAVYSEPNTEVIYKEIKHYNSEDSALVTKKLRELVGIEKAAEKFEKIYDKVIEEFKKTKISKEADAAAVADYIKRISTFLKKIQEEQWARHEHIMNLEENVQVKDGQVNSLNQELAEKNNTVENLTQENNAKEKHIENIEKEIEAMKYSKFWLLREKLLFLKKFYK